MSYYERYPVELPAHVTNAPSLDPYSIQRMDTRRDSGHVAKQTLFNEQLHSPTYAPLPVAPSQMSMRRRSAPPQSQYTQHQRSQRHRSQPGPMRLEAVDDVLHPQHSSNTAVEPDSYATFTSPHLSTTNPSIPDRAAFPPPLRLEKYAVHDLATNNARITITRNAVHMPSHFSSKPLLNLMRSDTGQAVGSIRFHHLTSSTVDLELVGVGSTRMEHDGHFSKRWKFSAFGGGEKGRYFCWCKSKIDGWELKEGGKKGVIIARLGAAYGLVLRFEKAELEAMEIDEIVLSAVAVIEELRRKQKESNWHGVEDDVKSGR